MNAELNFLKKIPKTDLHLHLDGSLRLGTIIELARHANVELPSYTEDGLLSTVFKSSYKNLVEYLHGFKYTCAVLRTKEALQRAAYELAIDCAAENTMYIEMRFAPQLHTHKNLSIREVIKAVGDGLSKASSEINARKDIVSGEVPNFAYGIIGCAMRMIKPGFSEYYAELFKMHPLLKEKARSELAAADLVRELIRSRNEDSVPVVAFDLAGAEDGYPAGDFQAAYDLAHRHFLKKTVHAGEAYGPASIFQAIADCHADRIGHGTHLFEEELVKIEGVDPKAYVESLVNHIADMRITLEVCLTSNLQTIPALSDIGNHPVKKMLEQKLSVTFCTDNRLISHTSSTRELELAVRHFGLNKQALRDITAYGFKRSFYHGSYLEKRKYVRKVLDYFDRCCRNDE